MSNSKNKLFSVDEDTKNLITDISTLSGHSQVLIREVFEYLLVDWAIKIAEDPESYTSLSFPFVGKINLKYDHDEIGEDNELSTIVDAKIELNKSFRSLVGNIYDEGYTEIEPLLLEKIKHALALS